MSYAHALNFGQSQTLPLNVVVQAPMPTALLQVLVFGVVLVFGAAL